jgi:hypothetical protein
LKIYFIFLLSLAATLSSSCKKDDSSPSPVACFLVDKTESTDSAHNFVFTDCTGPYHTYTWDFGDGYHSTEMNPTHVFNQTGTFNVKLTATNSSGKSGISYRTITIGHNTLTRIEVIKVNSNIGYPKHIYLNYFNVPLNLTYILDQAVASAVAVPFTVTLSDDPLYDNNPLSSFLFREDDLAGNSYGSGYFSISDLDVENGQIDRTFYYLNDSAKVRLHFAIVPR